MKGFKVTLAAVASALLLAAPAMAFHDGGVARCEGCHTMHNSLDGATMPTTAAYGGTAFQVAGFLLQGNGSTSDACLNCHQGDTDTGASSYHVSTISTAMDAVTTFPKQRTPGGDFGWINLNTGSKYKRGHNIVAPSHSYTADGRFTVASPGGTYPADKFNCASCHDPHGKYRVLPGTDAYTAQVTTGGNIAESGSYANIDTTETTGVFRLLAGVGYSPKSINGAHTFANASPVAIAPNTYNRTEATTDTRVVYGKGMSEWCANCHQSLYENAYVSGEAGHTHPAGNAEKLDSFIVTNYNSYIASGNLTGDGSAAYTSLVPYEEGSADRDVLKVHAVNDGSVKTGPDANANVMCLSCHRAHASGFNSMLRYAPDSFMTVDNGSGVSVYSVAADANNMLTAAYYDRPATNFIAYQRALCNKCHAKD